MGIIGEKWHCPTCDKDVGGSMGELKNHMKTHKAGSGQPR